MSRHCTRSLDRRKCPSTIAIENLNVTAHAGVYFLVDAVLDHPLITKAAEIVADYTDRSFNPMMKYTDLDLLLQRILMIVTGQRNISDVWKLKLDAAIRHKFKDFASPATLSRQQNVIGRRCSQDKAQKMQGGTHVAKHDERRISHELFDRLNDLLIEFALAQYVREPRWILLDFDNTFIDLHGDQDEKAFCGKNRHYGYFPLVGFINGIPAYIQNAPGATDGRKMLETRISHVLDKIHERFPNLKVVVRCDGGFNSDALYRAIEDHGDYYLCGWGQNAKAVDVIRQQACLEFAKKYSTMDAELPEALVVALAVEDPEAFELEQEVYLAGERPEKIHRFCGQLHGYKPTSWSRERSLIYRVQLSEKYDEVDFRLIATNIPDNQINYFCRRLGRDKGFTKTKNCPGKRFVSQRAIDLYDGLYADRGNCELAIKELKQGAYVNRMNSSDFFANFYNMMVSAFCVHVIERLRRTKLKGTVWANKTFDTIRRSLICIPGVIRAYARRTEIVISSLLPESVIDGFLALSSAIRTS